VPSAVVAGEANYVLNPSHPDLARITARIKAGGIEDFRFDSRVVSTD